jgi:hypothetical protein
VEIELDDLTAGVLAMLVGDSEVVVGGCSDHVSGACSHAAYE